MVPSPHPDEHPAPFPHVEAYAIAAALAEPRLALCQGDITTLKIDAIVNAANSAMLGCFQPCHNLTRPEIPSDIANKGTSMQEDLQKVLQDLLYLKTK